MDSCLKFSAWLVRTALFSGVLLIIRLYCSTIGSDSGLRLVKAYRCQQYAAGTIRAANDGIARSEAVLLKHQLIVQGITIFLQVAKTVLILMIGIDLISRNEMDIICLTFLNRLFWLRLPAFSWY